MTEKDVLGLFKKEKALLSGHFLLSSGMHSPNYMQCALLLQKPWLAEKLCMALGKKMQKAKFDVVIGPALGGMIVSYDMGRALGLRAIFAERSEGAFTLRRGFSLKKNEKVLIVEDVITTGKSTLEVAELVKAAGADVCGVASIVDRTGGSGPFQVPFYSLLKIDIKTYNVQDCPLCREGKLTAVKPGSRGSVK